MERGQREIEGVFDTMLWRAIADQAPLPIAGVYGPTHVFCYANRAFCQLTGRSSKEVIGTTFNESMWQAYLCVSMLDRVYQTGHAEVYTEWESMESEAPYLSFVMWPVLGADGRPAGVTIQGAALDGAGRAEAENQQSNRAEETGRPSEEERFRALANAVPNMVWSTDASGAVDFCNDRWYRFTGLTPAETLNEDGFLQALHPEDQARAWQAWRSAVETGNLYEIEYRLRRAGDGSYHWHLARGVPIRDTEGNLLRWFGTCTDIDRFVRAQESLIRTEKLASIGRMAVSLAHRINNPLEAVTNALYLVQRVEGLPGPVREYLEIAEEELRRVSHAARQSLGFYNESSMPTEFYVSPLLDSVCALLRAKIKATRVSVEKRCDEQLRIRGIPGELTQVLSNLLANSLDAVEEQGKVKIRASVSPRWGGRDRHVRLTIADNGLGIDKGALNRIFEPFFTTKGSVAAGLGLWVSKHLIDKHGGSIRVRSGTKGPHRGTVFSVVLPLEAGDSDLPLVESVLN